MPLAILYIISKHVHRARGIRGYHRAIFFFNVLKTDACGRQRRRQTKTKLDSGRLGQTIKRGILTIQIPPVPPSRCAKPSITYRAPADPSDGVFVVVVVVVVVGSPNSQFINLIIITLKRSGTINGRLS